MKVIYIVDFPIEGNSGKNKATLEKANALQWLLGEENFSFFSSKKPKSLIAKIFNKFYYDFLVLSKLLLRPANYIVIQRVWFMPLTRLLFYLKGVKVVSEFHADFKEEIPLLNKSKLEQQLLHVGAIFYNLNYKLSHGIIYNHPYLKTKFDKIFNKPSIFSYNGADTHTFQPMDKLEARKTLKLDADQFICLFLGSVSQWHGVDYLVNLFQQDFFKDGMPVKLYIVGAKDNVYVRSLKEKANLKHIEFLAPVDKMVAKYYINAADLCMLPVKSNRTSPGSPLKLYDYISCGRPVLTQKKLAGYADEVENYKLGWTIDFVDPDQAKAGFAELLEKKDFNDFSKNRDLAENQLNWSSRMTSWLNFIKTIN